MVIAMVAAPTIRAGTLTLTDCSYYANNGPAYQGQSNSSDLSTADECMVWDGTAYRSLEINTNGNVPKDQSANWSTSTPSSDIQIIGVYTPYNQVLIDCAAQQDGFTAQFYWGSYGDNYGTQSIEPSPSGPPGSICYGVGINRSITPSRYFGWAAGCYLSQQLLSTSDGSRVLGVRGIYLTAQENTGPTISPMGYGNLWFESSGWVRGSWPLSINVDDPSGVCSTQENVGNEVIHGPGDTQPDHSRWQQCPDEQLDHEVDTTTFPNGPLELSLSAENAASVVTWESEDVHVDNQPVNLTLSGPTDAPETAGTQYMTATATAGPSGVGDIQCSLDGGATRTYDSASVRLGVHGLGTHQLRCIAFNRALDSSWAYGSSSWQTRTLSIRQPSVSTISFGRLVRKLHCAKRRERVHVPGRWIVERVNGHRVRVRIRAQTRTIRVLRCRRRAVSRTVQRTTKRVRFGGTSLVSGWLGTANGNALGAQHVEVMTAPDDGISGYSLAATATTAANGTWSARLPAGPTRLVRAVYRGTAMVEPATSAVAHVIVPGSARLTIAPRRTHWGATIAIRGRLKGGHIPPAGELIVLWIGWRGGSAEIGHIYADTSGRFATPYTFLRGSGTERYRIWAATARESDYPFAPARSRKITVMVR